MHQAHTMPRMRSQTTSLLCPSYHRRLNFRHNPSEGRMGKSGVALVANVFDDITDTATDGVYQPACRIQPERCRIRTDQAYRVGFALYNQNTITGLDPGH